MISQKRWFRPLVAFGKFALMSVLVFFAAAITSDDVDKACGVLFAFWAFLCVCKWVFNFPYTASDGSSSHNPSNQHLVSLMLVLSLALCWGGYRIKSQMNSIGESVSNIESSVEDTATKTDEIKSSVDDAVTKAD